MAKDTIDTGTEDLLAHEEDGVVVITLNRPQARNAMSGEMNQALAETLDYAERAQQVRCIVITGAGGAFCAGGDVKGMAAGGGGGDQGPTLDERIHSQRLNQRNTAGRMYLAEDSYLDSKGERWQKTQSIQEPKTYWPMRRMASSSSPSIARRLATR